VVPRTARVLGRLSPPLGTLLRHNGEGWWPSTPRQLFLLPRPDVCLMPNVRYSRLRTRGYTKVPLFTSIWPLSMLKSPPVWVPLFSPFCRRSSVTQVNSPQFSPYPWQHMDVPFIPRPSLPSQRRREAREEAFEARFDPPSFQFLTRASSFQLLLLQVWCQFSCWLWTTIPSEDVAIQVTQSAVIVAFLPTLPFS